jgi:hypothetical protein
VGVALVLLGLVVIGLNVRGLDDVVVTFSSSHGVHLSDAVGAAMVCIGTWLVWIRR